MIVIAKLFANLLKKRPGFLYDPDRLFVCLLRGGNERRLEDEVRCGALIFSSIKELKCFQNIKKSSLNISSN